MSTLNKDSYYFRVTDLWQKLCEEHASLFNLTCDEYQVLLANDLEKLEDVLETKNDIINRIGHLEKLRQSVIDDLNAEHNIDISNVTELVTFFNDHQEEIDNKHLLRFNALLIDIIDKIQDQNKKSQIFLNKAIQSLDTLQKDAVGQKTYQTYNKMGQNRVTTY